MMLQPILESIVCNPAMSNEEKLQRMDGLRDNVRKAAMDIMSSRRAASTSNKNYW
ncbi:hypothetical protein PaecuDRAFT_4672 [Paenibacillus curdlanolyticus YK9]|uniref:Uncharacterized protein n=1 Tax=Paenibacillus curdlanolyticus YK9 TaxID=717606 RepID=E0IG81_9BACL|nr:hypothetical protein [Paenibacillus curdlanolyticus]EFM08483.1 hypothetical protein PaecuDRAFT_4672 [Paenibacillus curdlanolyticus YK9]